MSELTIDAGGERFDEDPVLLRPSIPAWSEREFVDFFRDREFEGSPTEGFLKVAEALVLDINSMQMHMQAEAEETEYEESMGALGIVLTLKPFDGQNVTRNAATKLYSHEESPATRAFRGRLEFMLRAQLVRLAPAEGGGELAYYQTRYSSPIGYSPISPYLIEHRWRDEGGDFTTLSLKSKLPADVLASFSSPYKSLADREFVSTQARREILETFHFEHMAEIPTADIDEAELVRRYFGRAA